ncbi:type II secretion system protein [Vibrio europaeus]|uniref:type II secretion system protein n=1 Tax=Vibrio europaeus TaxID=300876 RepID=UPI00233E826F|nr:type II secretion system protein [Vibrio europaeus]MDC5711152.1 type II secretion system protein [Vibrio europaeus]MDC5713181.1 type II secretion system protein [Vibrio europaeus]
MNISFKNQRGFAGIAALLIVLSVGSFGVIKYSEAMNKKRIVDNTESFYNRVLYYREQFHAYISDRYQAGWGINTASIFPTTFSALEGQYIPACSTADNDNGLCMKYNQTPWGDIPASAYSVVPIPNAASPTHYRAELVISLPDKNNQALNFEREITLQLFAQTPNIVLNDATNTVTLIIDRPDKAFAYDSLLKRSGDDSTLLGDWDIGGNYALTNAKDYFIRNSDGTQKGVSGGLVEVFTATHGQWLPKPSCPTGSALVPSFAIKRTDNHSSYTLTGMNNAYMLTETATQIRVGLDVGAKAKSNGQGTVLHGGQVTVFFQCQ